MKTRMLLGIGLVGLVLSAAGAWWAHAEFSRGMGDALVTLTGRGVARPRQESGLLPWLVLSVGLALLLTSGIAYVLHLRRTNGRAAG